ncbi:MAG: DUF1854 domain-containing protein [Saccharofermentanales bacterium]
MTTDEQDYQKILQEQLDKVNTMFEIKKITPETAAFTRTSGGFLSLKFEEKDYPRIIIYRSFPFTDPDCFLSVRDTTTQANEIGMIDSLNDWPADIKEMITEQLKIRYFSPIVTEIIDVKEEYGYAYWNILSDRGPLKFTASIWSPIARISEIRFLITDIDGNRYEIPDFSKLSHKEQKMIDLFI